MSKKRGTILLFVLLLVFWIILSFKVTPTIVIIGFFVGNDFLDDQNILMNTTEKNRIQGDSIRNFINYHSGSLSIIAFNKDGDIIEFKI